MVLTKNRALKSTTIPVPFAMLNRIRKSKSSDCSDKKEEGPIPREKIISNHISPTVGLITLSLIKILD